MNIILKPIGIVNSTRKEIADDNWRNFEAKIILNQEFPEGALAGIEDFSHLEIIYYFHKVNDNNIAVSTRHPRNNKDFPLVGTWAQRNKNRPNRLGLTTVKLVGRQGRELIVEYLDAIDGTPVLDIKPVMTEFLPQGEVRQPEWSVEIMKNYW